MRVRGRSADSVPPELPLLGAVASVQFGAAFANKIFDRAGPSGVALLRVLFTAVVLLIVVRPSIRGRSRHDLALMAAYGLNLAILNWTFYEALHRLPLGVAVTIEFTGPLAVAVIGSRRPLDLVWAALAATGVVLLASRGSSAGVQPLGVLLVLIAATLWAVYILLAKRVTAVWPASHALGLGMAVGTLVVLPAGILQGGRELLAPAVLGVCFAVAMLSSLIPYTLELIALRRLSTAVFGLLMSIEPAVAAIAGVVVLGQRLTLLVAVAIVLVVLASVGVTLSGRRAAVPDP